MLQPGDVVLAPFVKNDGKSKTRPGLVIEVAMDDDAREIVVRLAYGTSQQPGHLAPWEFSIFPTDGSAWTASGLLVATKFEFNCCQWARASSCKQVGVISHAIGPRMMKAAREARFKGYL